MPTLEDAYSAMNRARSTDDLFSKVIAYRDAGRAYASLADAAFEAGDLAELQRHSANIAMCADAARTLAGQMG